MGRVSAEGAPGSGGKPHHHLNGIEHVRRESWEYLIASGALRRGGAGLRVDVKTRSGAITVFFA